MRRFRFRFETVLKQRAILEELRLQAFAVVQNELAAVDARMAACRSQYLQTVAGRPASIDVEDIGRREQYVDALIARLAQEERIREGISARLEDARAALMEARRACQSLERIREKDFEEYQRSATRTEQSEIDEIATQRYSRRA